METKSYPAIERALEILRSKYHPVEKAADRSEDKGFPAQASSDSQEIDLSGKNGLADHVLVHDFMRDVSYQAIARKKNINQLIFRIDSPVHRHIDRASRKARDMDQLCSVLLNIWQSKHVLLRRMFHRWKCSAASHRIVISNLVAASSRVAKYTFDRFVAHAYGIMIHRVAIRIQDLVEKYGKGRVASLFHKYLLKKRFFLAWIRCRIV
jgi:hypothetical protein